MTEFNLEGNVYATEPMGMFDGPGVRYVLFLQGCPFRCKFCHNRDSWSTAENKLMTVKEVYADYKKYRSFYKRGGITVSGGEPLLQIDFLLELFKFFKHKGIHTCIDTSGGTFNANYEKMDELLTYTDLILLDIKHIDNEEHKRLVGTENIRILEFAKYLSNKDFPVYIRHVLIPGITANDYYLFKLREFLDTLTNVIKIDILPYHTKGVRKWKALEIDYPLIGTREPTKEELINAAKILIKDYKFKTI